VDPASFTRESWFRTNWMTVEFSLVYRWHSALPEWFTYNQKLEPMAKSLWNNEMLINQGLGALFAESSAQPATKIGLFNTPEFLIQSTELASIELGRQAKLPSYNAYRQLCGFPAVTDFDQITGNTHAQGILEQIYGSVDQIEFYVGLYAEDVRENSALSPLIGRMVGADAFSQALTNPLLSANLFNAETFSKVGWAVINETRSLSDLVNRNVPQSQHFKVTFDQ
jgi:prostaglandin-endoperoxide synthase 2